MRYVGVFLLNVTNWITVTKFLTRANSINISKLGNFVFIATFMVDLIISHFLVQTLVDPLFLQLNVWTLYINSKSPIPLCLLVASVVSIGLFWFCFVSFLYNGVYFLQVFFNHTLSQYQRANSFLSAENYVLPLTLWVKGSTQDISWSSKIGPIVGHKICSKKDFFSYKSIVVLLSLLCRLTRTTNTTTAHSHMKLALACTSLHCTPPTNALTLPTQNYQPSLIPSSYALQLFSFSRLTAAI